MGTATNIALSADIIAKRNVEMIANNLANAGTAGFKADKLGISELKSSFTLYDELTYAHYNGMYRDLSQGSINYTGDPYHVALNNHGYFAIETPNGIGYTRDGIFTTNANGELVNSVGNPVLDQNNGVIVIDTNAKVIRISEDGTISADGNVVAQIGVFTFDDENALQKTGDGLYISTDEANLAPTPSMIPGAYEESNVNPVLAMSQLIENQRNHQQYLDMMRTEQQMITAESDQLLTTA